MVDVVEPAMGRLLLLSHLRLCLREALFPGQGFAGVVPGGSTCGCCMSRRCTVQHCSVRRNISQAGKVDDEIRLRLFVDPLALAGLEAGRGVGQQLQRYKHGEQDQHCV